MYREQGPVVLKAISTNSGLNLNPGFFITSLKCLFRTIFSILISATNHQIVDKIIKLNLLFKFPDLKTDFTPTLGYRNPALNITAQYENIYTDVRVLRANPIQSCNK